MEKREPTQVWSLFESGRLYNNSLVPNQYTLVDTNTEFYAGNQWLHLAMTPAMAALPKPIFNIIKRVVNTQVAGIISPGYSFSLSPMAYYDASSVADPDSNACAFAQAEIENVFEKVRFDYRSREALFDAAISGDFCAHWYFDPTATPFRGRLGSKAKGEIRMELVDGINVMFGNPTITDVQSQPYIIIVGRDTVKNLNDEMRRNRKNVPDCEEVLSDYSLRDQVGQGGKAIVNSPEKQFDQATYLYMYYKVTKKVEARDDKGNPIMRPVVDKQGNPVYETDKDGKPVLDSYGMKVIKMKPLKEDKTTVHVVKCTEFCEIIPDTDTELSLYPVAWGVWEKQKNQYHGRALVTGIIPNQISINSAFAMWIQQMRVGSFPRRVYNADYIASMTNEIGMDIAVHGLPPGTPINQVVTTLTPSDMSAQVVAMIDKAVDMTKDCLGSTEAQLGSSRIDNTSTLMLLDANSRTPLENPRARYDEWVEDCVEIVMDMMATYYGERPVVRDRTFEEPVINEATGLPTLGQYDGQMKMKSVKRKVVELFDFSTLKNLNYSTKIAVGAGTSYNQPALVQHLENLRRDGLIDAIDYFERLPDSIMPNKEALIQKLKGEAAVTDSGVPAGMALPSEGGAEVDNQIHTVLQQMNPDKLNKTRKPTDKAPTVDDAISDLSVNVKEQFDELPSRAKGEVSKIISSRLEK